MRLQNSMKNIHIGIITQVVMTLLGFITRKIFIDSLGTEYLGINGLLTNILSMLSLIEGGIGASIVYNLYEPLANGDKPRIIALVQLYKKLYTALAIIMFTLSIALYPFLDIMVKDFKSIPYVAIAYFIFVLRNVVSYLNAHKWSLINCDQKGYILSRYNLVFNIITSISKIVVLYITNNYVLYLLIEVIIFIIQNLWNGKIVNDRYSYIKTKEKYKVDKSIKENLINNFKALILHKIGSYCVLSTDNLLISAFINIKTVGLYSNYTMITAQLSSLVGPILGGVTDSIGNLIASEGEDKRYEIFNIIYLVNFWIYCICTIFLYNLLEPFIDWWLGEGLLLDKFTFIVVLINFYLFGMRISILNFKNKAGIFTNDKYIPLIEAIVNLTASFILVKHLGLAGIFLGTTISTISMPLWIQAKLVYNNVFNKSVFVYLKKYIAYLGITLFICVITTFLCNNLVLGNSFVHLVQRGIICVVIPNIILTLIFYKTKEFKYLYNIVTSTLKNKLKKSVYYLE